MSSLITDEYYVLQLCANILGIIKLETIYRITHSCMA